jgi:hypothetical protein
MNTLAEAISEILNIMASLEGLLEGGGVIIENRL